MAVVLTKKSIITGRINEMVLPLSEEDFLQAFQAWRGGALIQDVFPTLNDTQREFILTGMSEEEQERAFGGDDDGEEE